MAKNISRPGIRSKEAGISMNRISLKQVETSERFYRVPKALLLNPAYKDMRAESKMVYAILKDRLELSIQNNRVDEKGDVYLNYSIKSLEELLGFGNKKIISIKKELQEFGLIEEERQGLNRANRIYVGEVDPENLVIHRAEALQDMEVSKRHFRKCQNNTSRDVKTTLQEVSKSHSNDTELSDTKLSDTESFKKKDDDELISNTPAHATESSQSKKRMSHKKSKEEAFGEISKILQAHQDLRLLFQSQFEDILFNDPVQAVIVLKSLLKQKAYLENSLRNGNNVLDDGIKIQGQGYLIKLIEQESKAQLTYMAEHLLNSENFGQYFDHGLTNRIKVAINTIYKTQLF